MSEYGRPWKLATLALGLSLLIAGSFYYQAPDWDIPICFIMAFCTYVAAPFCLRVLLERRWTQVPAALFLTWFSVDGCYWLYWHFKNPRALELMREANFLASLSLYGACAVIWLYRGSLSDMAAELRAWARALTARDKRR